MTFNTLQNFAEMAFQIVSRPKEKLLSDGIHDFWNPLIKSTGSKPKMLLLLKSKLLETNPGALDQSH